MQHHPNNLTFFTKGALVATAFVALCAFGKSASASSGQITAVYPAPDSVVDTGYISVGGDVKLATGDYGGVIDSTFDFKKDGALAFARLETHTLVGAHEDKTFPVRMVNNFATGKYTATYNARVDFYDGTWLSGSLPTNFEVRMGINDTFRPAPGGGGLAGP
jgi:hypothetical protein